MLDSHFVILGAVVALGGTTQYVLNTLHGKTKPNRISWVIWTLAPMIAFAAELKTHVGIQSLATFMAGFCPLLVLVASFANRKSVWRLTRFDFICGALSIVGLVLWQISGQGNLAISFSILADGLAAMPTIVKAYSYPETETWQGFATSAFSVAITLATIKKWTFANYGFPIYLLIICLLMVYLIKLRPAQLRLKLQS